MRYNFFAAALAVSSVSAAAIEPRAVIAYDQVVGFPQTVPSGVVGAAYLRYKPWLEVTNGCVPFPAVDKDGNTSGGLDTKGGQNEGCAHNIGQVYARAGAYAGRYALMYTWYMPKDSPAPGMGHRHDWENAVVWIDDVNSDSPKIQALSASAHGGYATVHDDILVDLFLDGTRPKIGYISIWPLNHQLVLSFEKGGEQPLIAWESLTDAAREALTNTDFGDANFPLKDGAFEQHLEKAKP